MDLRNNLFARASLRQIETFVHAYELGSLVRTAERLSITQPAVTKRLKDLETDIGADLFRRIGRGIEPTAFGDALYGHAVTVLSELRAADARLESIRDGDGGTVAIGVSPVATTLVARAVIALKRQWPAIHVQVTTGPHDDLIAQLDSGVLELVIARFGDSVVEKRFDRTEVTAEPLHVIAGAKHPVCRKTGVTLADLADEPWVLPTPDEIVRPRIDGAFRAAIGDIPGNVVETISISMTRSLIANGGALTISPRLIYLDDFDSGAFVTLPIDLGIRLRPIGISQRRSVDLSPPARRLFDSIVDVTKEI